MSNWRLAASLDTLRAEVNTRWPGRDKTSDGTIGDTAHANTGSASDHNPWVTDGRGVGVVRAFDIDSDLDPNDTAAAARLAERFRSLGAMGDPRLVGGGYVIFAGQIASENHDWWWRAYTGADPHTSHIHLSVTRNAPDYDDTSPWGIAAPAQEEDDMTPHEHDTLEYVRNTADGHTAVLQEIGKAIDELKAEVAALAAK